MPRDYVESKGGRLVYAWRRDDRRTWDIFVHDLRREPRRIAALSGSKTHAQVICQALATCGSVLTPMFRLDDPLSEEGGDDLAEGREAETQSNTPMCGREGNGCGEPRKEQTAE